MKSKAGFVYVLSNEAMPGIVKIGMTLRDPTVRLKEINSATGVLPFKLEAVIVSKNAKWTEREVHDRLAARRISSKREFFRVDVESARKIAFITARKQHQKAYYSRSKYHKPSVAMAVCMLPSTFIVHPIIAAVWMGACIACGLTGRPRVLREFISSSCGLIPAFATGIVAFAIAAWMQGLINNEVLANLSASAHRIFSI